MLTWMAVAIATAIQFSASDGSELDHEEVAAKVQAATGAVSSYRMEGSVSIEVEEGADQEADQYEMALSIDWLKPDRFHAVPRNMANEPSYQEVIVVGQRVFTREDPSGQWEEESGDGPYSVTIASLSEGPMPDLSGVSWQSATSEFGDFIRLEGTRSTTRGIPSEGEFHTDSTFSIQIAGDSYLVENFSSRITVRRDDNLLSTQEATYQFSAYNEPFVIEIPIP